MNKQLRMNTSKINLVPADLIYIMSSFLLPRDLCRFRILSKEYYKIITNYLINVKKTVNLFDLVCPMCGNDWIDTNNDLDLNDFSDIDSYTHYFEVIERQKYILEMFGNSNKRQHLLCNNCEDKFQETYSLYHFKLYHNYQLYIDFYSPYPWICIVKTDNEGKYIWNQYNCAIQIYEEEDDEREFRQYTAEDLGLVNYDYDWE